MSRLGVAVQSLTIGIGTATSNAFSGDGYAAFGLQMPAAFTGTSITFAVSADGSTFQTLYPVDDNVTPVTVSVTQGRSYPLPDALTSWRAWKIVSASSEVATRTLVVVGKG